MIKNKSQVLKVAVAVALCVPIAAEAGLLKKIARAVKHFVTASINLHIDHALNSARLAFQQATGHFSLDAIAHVIHTDYQNLQSMGIALITPLTDCDLGSVSTPYGSITTYCFDGEDRGNIQAGINRLVAFNANNGYMSFNGQWVSPMAYSARWTTSFYDMDSPTEVRFLFPEYVDYPFLNDDCGPIDELLGCHFAGFNSAGTTGLTPSAMLISPTEMGALILHEAHHSPYGSHRTTYTGPSGSPVDGDNDCEGPYVIEAAFIKDAVSGAVPYLSQSEVAQSQGRLAHLTTYRVPPSCGTNILNRPGFGVSGATYVPPPVAVCVVGYDESGQQFQTCAVRQASSAFTPPPPPAPIPVCFVDESGQICF